MLEIKLGEKLKPKKSRKTMGGNKRVEHHIVTAFQWRSLHLDENEDEEEERLMDAETDMCISEAHSSLTRRFSPAVMAVECLNTYSLAALLSKISHYAAVACSYLTALNRVRGRFFPFTVEDGLVTVGFVSLTLEQSLTLAVDFSAGFSAAPSSVKVASCLFVKRKVCTYFFYIQYLGGGVIGKTCTGQHHCQGGCNRCAWPLVYQRAG